MELPEAALLLIIDSAWSVGMKRGVDEGYHCGLMARSSTPLSKSAQLAAAIRVTAKILTEIESTIALKAMDAGAVEVGEIFDAMWKEFRRQEKLLPQLLETEMTVDAVDPHATDLGTPSTRDKVSSSEARGEADA